MQGLCFEALAATEFNGLLGLITAPRGSIDLTF
jgi:hypothetical protein